ncbi:MAG: HAD-IIB family hydrolase [Rhodospirillales bacterium]|nr:HAD-IIB family hydrolase [Rhodospirillales bacterium]MBO6788394.1 HAD-IIB family hydrolase [Rhodospirillales bacterium]
MLPIAAFPEAQLRVVRGVFTDIDDTLTTDGRLTAEAYGAMEALQDVGVAVIPITGRPAGWCDHIARMWPVSGVVGENGAFYFHYDRDVRRMNRRYVDADDVRAENRRRLMALGADIVKAVPGAAISADQAYRETDLAIDFCEDVAPLPPESIDRIVALMVAAGATAKVSSIHVNGWFGDYDKLTMTKLFAADCLGVDLEQAQGAYVFTGDSPNDAPMFAFFDNAVGVANVRDFADRLTSPPAYITAGYGGAGFAEVAALIRDAQSGG